MASQTIAVQIEMPTTVKLSEYLNCVNKFEAIGEREREVGERERWERES